MKHLFFYSFKALVIANVIAGCILWGVLFFLTRVPWVDLSTLEHDNPGTPSIVLDDQGNEWARFQLDRHSPIPLSAIPKHVIQAFIVAEDRHFFTHSGISYRGIIRSALINLARGKKLQGASTITQQLVRLLFFDHKKSFIRKIKEQMVAIAVERQYTKEKILETYLNNIYFGCGIYGVEAASQRFWQKSVDQITAGEAATLAAIIRNPSFYCPLSHQTHCTTRRNLILKSLRDTKDLTETEYRLAVKNPVVVLQEKQRVTAPHAREMVRQYLENLIGKQALYTGGYTIQTTLSSQIQQEAAKSFTRNMTLLRKELGNTLDGSLVTLEVTTGNIKALVGGFDFKQSPFNRATMAYRQIGSIFKPIIYAAALDHGYDLDTIMIDEPLTIHEHGTTWSPQNFYNSFEGPMTLAHALSISNNIIAVKLLLHTGIGTIIDYARKFRLNRQVISYPSLALGCAESTALESAQMFNVFAHKGIYHESTLILWIKDRWGKKIWKHVETADSIISWGTSSKIAHVLSHNFKRFQRRRPTAWPNAPEIICKTGTTNQSRSCWFAGSTPSYTTVVYIGRDNNDSIGNRVFPSSTAFPIWLDCMKNIYHQERSFDYNPSLTPKIIHPLSAEILTHEDFEAGRAISILK